MVSQEKKALSVCVLYGMCFFFSPQRYPLHQPPHVRCIEALTRAGQTDRQLLPKAVSMFEVRTWDSYAIDKKLMDFF